MLQQLMPHYGLFCVDLEGHGDSDRPAHFSGSKAIAPRIAPVIADQQPGGQTLVGMGHSSGAALTVRATAEKPHLFRALSLLAPTLLPTSLWPVARLPPRRRRNQPLPTSRRRRARRTDRRCR